MTEYIKQKYNINTSHWEFSIKIYIGELLYKLLFIILIL